MRRPRGSLTAAVFAAFISAACAGGGDHSVATLRPTPTSSIDPTSAIDPVATTPADSASTPVTTVASTTATTALATTTPAGPVTTAKASTSSTHPATSPTTRASAPASFAGVWRPAANTSWQWMISHALDLSNAKDMGLVDPSGNALPNPAPTVYDIDWEYNSASTVAQLHAQGKHVICYVDVGVYESYRPDAASFPASVRGNKDSHWQGSFWLDVRQQAILLPIMKARLQMCKNKGFDAVEPDEIDGYSNSSGFPLTYADQLAYNRAIADLAHSLGMSVGLKGDIDQVKDLWSSFDWTLNEQCFEFSECAALSTYFVGNGKAVFEVEYDDPFSGHHADPAAFCPQANAANFNSMKMPLDLDGGRWPCR